MWEHSQHIMISLEVVGVRGFVLIVKVYCKENGCGTVLYKGISIDYQVSI